LPAREVAAEAAAAVAAVAQFLALRNQLQRPAPAFERV
jgi:hypothetical protein